MAHYRRLGHTDRYQISALLKQGSTQQQIADHLGVSQGTVSRELARNSLRGGYRIEQAHAKAQARYCIRARPRKLTSHVRRTIVRLLRHKRRSPEQISAHLAKGGTPLSHESIYRLIWRDKRAGGELWCCLRRQSAARLARASTSPGHTTPGSAA